MKRSLIKLFAIIAIIILSMTAVMSIVNATGENTGFSLDEARKPSQYDGANDKTGTARLMNSWLGSALVVVQVVGVGVAVIMLVVLAIKYISAAPSDKAEIKKHAVVYVVGAIVLFAASGILELIRRFALQANDTFKEEQTQ